jgi:hypothetical protein
MREGFETLSSLYYMSWRHKTKIDDKTSTA